MAYLILGDFKKLKSKDFSWFSIYPTFYCGFHHKITRECYIMRDRIFKFILNYSSNNCISSIMVKIHENTIGNISLKFQRNSKIHILNASSKPGDAEYVLNS